MPKIQSFRDLIAWQKAMDLADMIYDATESFPARECELATRRRFISAADRKRVEDLIAEVGRITHGLVRSLDPNGEAS